MTAAVTPLEYALLCIRHTELLNNFATDDKEKQTRDKLFLTCICHPANKGTSRHGLAVELNVNRMRLRGLGREMDEAPPSSEHLHMVGDLAVVDGDLELSLSGLRCVHSELARLAHYSVSHIGYTNQIRVVHFKEDRRFWDLKSGQVDVHDVAAHILGQKFNVEEAVILRQTEKCNRC